MLRSILLFISVILLWGCCRDLVSHDTRSDSRENVNDPVLLYFSSYVIRGTILTTNGEPCSGVIACISDTGIFTGTATGPASGSFELSLDQKQFKLLRALQITASCCDTIVEIINGASYSDSIIDRGFRLFIEPQKFMVMRGHAIGTSEGEDIVDTVWFKQPLKSSFNSSFIIVPKYNDEGSVTGIPVDTILPGEHGTFDVRRN